MKNLGLRHANGPEERFDARLLVGGEDLPTESVHASGGPHRRRRIGGPGSGSDRGANAERVVRHQRRVRLLVNATEHEKHGERDEASAPNHAISSTTGSEK